MKQQTPSDAFFDRLRRNPQPVIVEVWAPWCAPCRSMGPILDRVSQRYHDQIDLLKLNADEEIDLVRALGVRSIPTLLGFRAGEEILRRTGTQSPAALESLFEAVSSGRHPVQSGPAPLDRILRLLVGVALLILGWAVGPSLLLWVLGGGTLFSAVHDRCPLWQALSPRLSNLVRRAGR